ncbi:MAG TPA: DUF1592 domain-containing protein [Lacipirellula sp.]
MKNLSPNAVLHRSFAVAAMILCAATFGRDAYAGEKEDQPLEPRPAMETALAPFIGTYCIDCHSGAEAEAGLNFEKLLAAPSVPHHRLPWQRVVERVTAGEMPPEEFGQPEPDEKEAVLKWLAAELADPDCSLPQDPGRVTMRRLNRTEYQNTIRDLVGVEYDASAVFPRDELAFGFDNNGDVLSLPTVLLEKYLAAAEEIAAKAIVTPESILDPADEFTWGELHGGDAAGKGARALFTNGRVWAEAHLEKAGDYIVRVKAFATQAGDEPTKMRVFIGREEVRTFNVEADHLDPQVYVARFHGEKGLQLVGAELINDTWEPWAKDPDRRDRNLYIQTISVVGPTKAFDKRRLPESHRQLLSWSPQAKDWAEGDAWKEPLREQIGRLLIRAYRRPPTAAEIDRLAELAAAARQRGDSYQRAMQLVLQATLVSPQFLFRGEANDDGDGVRQLNDYELATRLSYFLWSSMPDEELLKLAADGTLREQFDVQIDRMLASPRSDELIRNFSEQWLETRKLETLEKNAELFPAFGPELRDAFREETYRLFEDVVRNDLPLTTLLSADYSFVNATLAEHYGIDDFEAVAADDEVEDAGDSSNEDEFIRIDLPKERQAGILAHGSVLAVTAFEDRTSPVLRGKWVLDHLLNDPPPPPPPTAGSLPEGAGDTTHLSFRERLAIHRDNPSCSACHVGMDPLGFAMENFDAVGRWRQFDGEEKIDASGELPDGRKLSGVDGLRDVLLADFPRIRRAIAERLLTYALGRGLEPSDECAVKEIVSAAEANGDTFSSMVRAIAKSAPFTKRSD